MLQADEQLYRSWFQYADEGACRRALRLVHLIKRLYLST